MTNMDKLYDSVAANGPVCVGLDTEIGYLPATDPAKTAGENVVEFNRAVIAATRGVAGCYKVQIAYYESLGLDGLRGKIPFSVKHLYFTYAFSHGLYTVGQTSRRTVYFWYK